MKCCSPYLPDSEAVDKAFFIPLVFHGDEADAHRRRSFCVCSFCSLLVSGKSPFDSKYLIYLTDVNRCVEETWDVLDAWAAYSFMELQHGQFFSVSPFNEDEADGFSSGQCRGNCREVSWDPHLLERR